MKVILLHFVVLSPMRDQNVTSMEKQIIPHGTVSIMTKDKVTWRILYKWMCCNGLYPIPLASSHFVHTTTKYHLKHILILQSDGREYVSKQFQSFLKDKEPATYKTALKVHVWLTTMKEEVDALHSQNGFLHGILQKEVYMAQPLGFVDPNHPTLVSKLHKSLYGLKQAPRVWNERFTAFIPIMGFKNTYFDSSLFVKQVDYEIVILLLYVDDIIITGNASNVIQETKYVHNLLVKTEMNESSPCDTPFLPYTRLLKNDGQPYGNPILYKSIVGALQYLTFTRPDIAFSMHQVYQFMQTLMVAHFTTVKRILRSSTKAEYRVLSTTSAELGWIKQLLVFMHAPISNAPVLFCDNLFAITLSFNLVQHQKTKHIEIDVHFVRERVAKQQLFVQFVSSREQFADILIKGLNDPLFQTHCNNLMLSLSKQEIDGGC
ncbi:unnamed protein product [Malus baccata var. baccata]